jgi:hypothetical protein
MIRPARPTQGSYPPNYSKALQGVMRAVACAQTQDCKERDQQTSKRAIAEWSFAWKENANAKARCAKAKTLAADALVRATTPRAKTIAASDVLLVDYHCAIFQSQLDRIAASLVEEVPEKPFLANEFHECRADVSICISTATHGSTSWH